MSTGDQSDYIRGKLAVRGKAALEQAPKFMQDGFDRWASKTEVGSGGRLMDLPQKENSGGRRKTSSYLKGLILDGGAANPDSSQAIARYSKELADKGLRLGIKKNKKILAGQDAEADEEAFNQALQEWQDYYFGLPKELQKFASQGSEDLAAESEELQNRVDRFLFDQRQKKLREERDLAGKGLKEDALAGIEAIMDLDVVNKTISTFGNIVKPLVPTAAYDAIEKVGQFGSKMKNIATDVRKSLQSPQVIEKVRSRTSPPELGEKILTSVTDFMELVGLGRFKGSKDVVRKIMKSKPFKQYNSGEYGETIDAFRKYAQTRGNPTSSAELKAMLKKQAKDAKSLVGSAKKLKPSIAKLTAPPADVTAKTAITPTKRTWAEYFKEWSDYVTKIYKELEKGAPTLVMAMESKPMDNLLKRTERPQIGREIADVTRVIFPAATKDLPKPKELGAADGATDGAGRYMNGKGLDKSLGLEYYLNRIKTLEDSGHMTKEAADAKRKEYRDFFSKSGSGSCCKGCDGGGMCEGSGILEDMRGSIDSKMKGLEAEARGKIGKGGRKPSAYAQFVKQFAAKHPGPNLMKRAGEAWRSQGKKGGKTIQQTDESRAASMAEDKREFEDMFNRLGNEFTNRDSVMQRALFGAPPPAPQPLGVLAMAKGKDPVKQIGTDEQREKLRKAGIDPDSKQGQDILIAYNNKGKGRRRVRRGKGALEDSFNWLSNQIMPKKVEAFGSPLGRLDGGRKPSAYAQFVKQYAAKHPGPDLMKRAAAAWKSQK